MGKRQENPNRVVIGKGVDVILVTNNERSDSNATQLRFANKDFVDFITQRNVNTFQHIQWNQKDTEENPGAKNDYRHAIREAARTKKPTTIVEHAHGQPNHLWLTNPDTNFSSYKDSPRTSPFGMNIEEYAEDLVNGQKDAKEIDLSHIIFIKMACYQWNFTEILKDVILLEAKKQGKKVKSFPTIMTQANENLAAFNCSTHPTNCALWNTAEQHGLTKEEPILLKHLFAIDTLIKTKRKEDPAIFIPIDPEELRSKLNLPKEINLTPFLEISMHDAPQTITPVPLKSMINSTRELGKA